MTNPDVHFNTCFNPRQKALLFLDTETTGLERKIDLNRPFEWKARMLEITFTVVHNITLEVLYTITLLHLPKEVIFEKDFSLATFVHGITEEELLYKGLSFECITCSLCDILNTFDIVKIVGHNIRFDISIICSELSRINRKDLINILLSIDLEDTMNLSKQIYGKCNKLVNLFEIVCSQYNLDKMYLNTCPLELDNYDFTSFKTPTSFNPDYIDKSKLNFHRTESDVFATYICYKYLKPLCTEYLSILNTDGSINLKRFKWLFEVESLSDETVIKICTNLSTSQTLDFIEVKLVHKLSYLEAKFSL
jgi:DNA polymerase III epsilon subunit-like protein